MPIMLPIADSLDVTRQTAVLAFQLGSGFMDAIIPTSGVLMAELSLAKIPYNKWFKWFMPLLVIYILIDWHFNLRSFFKLWSILERKSKFYDCKRNITSRS